MSNNMSRYTMDSMSLRPSTMSQRLAAASDQLRPYRVASAALATASIKRDISARTRQQVENNYATSGQRAQYGRNQQRRSQKDRNVINNNINNNSIDESIKCFNRKLDISRRQFKDDEEIDSDFSSLSSDEHSIESDKKDETIPGDMKADSSMDYNTSKLQESSMELKKGSLSSGLKSMLMDHETRATKRIKKSFRGSTESQEKEELICSCGGERLANNNNDDDRHQSSEQELELGYINNSNNSPRKSLIQPHKLVNLGNRNDGQGICNKHMPWFGIDVGGSLVKVVFFDPKDATREETVTLKRIRRYLKSSKAYGTTGKRDAHLEMPNCVINKRAGSLHFIRFATNQMPQFLAMAKNKGFADTINTVCATGGGANMFEEDIKTNLGITLHKTDELDSIIHGINYIDKHNSFRECYFLEDPLNDEKCVKVPYDFSHPYPYLVVNIGSGVSILAVYSSRSYSRISGSSIGGGTFLGLCSLLTQCKTFDEAIKLAKAGSSTSIDKLVKDIYGGDYLKFNLSGDTVASSFGHMNIEQKRKNVKREDLARALLEMVTTNIGSIARMCAANENIDRVVFIGNFLRVNQLSMKLLSYAVNYWSKGAIKALFLEHEGYFGAVGCFVESTQGCNIN